MAAIEKPEIARQRDRMDKCVGALKEEFVSLRTGRASAGLLDQVMVDAYGAKVPISQVAAVSVWDKGVGVSGFSAEGMADILSRGGDGLR